MTVRPSEKSDTEPGERLTKKKTCARDGAGNIIRCGEPAKKRGRCLRHYQQWHRLQAKCRAASCNRIQAAHYYCRPHERLALSTRTDPSQADALERFRSNIEADPFTGCWLWTGGTNEKGYGMHSAGGSWLAHRFSYVWFYGGHATGKVLDHLCNVSRCVRPDHLWPITNTSNISLMHQRALAGDLEYWRHARVTPYSVALIRWATVNQLPWRKPTVGSGYAA